MPPSRNRRKRAVIIGLFAIGMIVSGLSTTSSAAISGTPPGSPASAPPDGKIGTPCKAAPKARCGKIRRWLDPGDHSAGTIGVHYELYPRTDKTKPSLGTIMAVEGGPGYASGGTRDWYYELFAPLLDRRQLLLVDLRGTGHSNAINCKKLQSYTGNWTQTIGACGRQLGDQSDVWGSAFAADDVVGVLDHLGIDKIDLYGDSYGTFFAQTFGVRHPERTRTLMLDGAYFVGGTDPWYEDTNIGLRYAFDVACQRSPACAKRPGSAMARITRMADSLRRNPIIGKAQNAEGVTERIRVDNDDLILILNNASTSHTNYRELDAAVRAALRPRPYPLPLMRLAREAIYEGDGGPYKQYSEGLAQAVTCNDYPMPYDMTAPQRDRRPQMRASARALASNVFAPFTRKEWIYSSYGYYEDCLKWPVPSTWVPAVPPDATYLDTPVLVINGDLDALTSTVGGRDTAAAFPNATYVETYNSTHVSALEDWRQCASVLARRFVRTLGAGDISCRKDYHENRLVDRFVRTAQQTGWNGNLNRTARVANATAADVMARWYQMYGARGVGLAGGTFSYSGGYFTEKKPIVTFELKGVRWVNDVAVTGTMRWFRKTGRVVLSADVAGRGAVASRVRVTWNDREQHAKAKAVVRAVGSSEAHRFRFPSA